MVKATRKQVDETAAEAGKTTDEGVEALTRGMEDAARFGRQNLDAVVATSRIAAKAHERVGAEVAAYAKKSCEDGLAAAKDLSTSKSVTEFMEKQTTYARTAVETYVSESTKINDIYVAAARDAFAPFAERFSATVEKAGGARV